MKSFKELIEESIKDKVVTKFNKAFWWDKSITDPKKVRDHVRAMSDKDLLSLAQKDDEKMPHKATPRALQIKLIAQEIKRRGLK